MTDDDVYVDWDAAYVLGSLSPQERRDYERHLETCERCSAQVAELAGLPGLLAKVPVDEAIALESAPDIPMPETLLPRLVWAARRRRRRVGLAITSGVVAAAGIAAALVLALPAVFPAGQPQAPVPSSQVVSLSQVVPTPLSASIRITSEGWGTRLEMDCSYGPPASGPVPSYGSADAHSYGLYVTDRTGHSTQVATWSSSPGTTAEPSGTTSLDVAQITSIDVRSETDGTVLLEGTP